MRSSCETAAAKSSFMRMSSSARSALSRSMRPARRCISNCQNNTPTRSPTAIAAMTSPRRAWGFVTRVACAWSLTSASICASRPPSRRSTCWRRSAGIRPLSAAARVNARVESRTYARYSGRMRAPARRIVLPDEPKRRVRHLQCLRPFGHQRVVHAAVGLGAREEVLQLERKPTELLRPLRLPLDISRAVQPKCTGRRSTDRYRHQEGDQDISETLLVGGEPRCARARTRLLMVSGQKGLSALQANGSRVSAGRSWKRGSQRETETASCLPRR